MKRWLALLLLAACSRGESVVSATSTTTETMPTNAKPIVIDDASQVVGAVDKLVTLVGVHHAAKQPTVLGVDVDGDHELDGKRVRVTGILRRFVVPERPPADDEEIVATRGPGTYYSVVDPRTRELARPVLDE